MEFNRGDLVLESGSKYHYETTVYLLIDRVDEEYESKNEVWWVRDLGNLQYSNGWSKWFTIEKIITEDHIKISPNQLSKSKQKVYQEFLTKYVETDIV